MGFVEMKADIVEGKGDTIMAIFAWYERLLSKGGLSKCVIPCINGARISGFEFLNKLREESQIKGLRLMVVKNSTYVIEPFSVEEAKVIDLVRRYKGGTVGYWFEASVENKKVISDTISCACFIIKGYTWVEMEVDQIAQDKEDEEEKADKINDKIDDDEVEEDSDVKVVVDKKTGAKKNMIYLPVTLIVPCGANPKKERDRILAAEGIVVSGMEVDVSLSGSYNKEKHILANTYSLKRHDLTLANLALMKINHWRELAPLVNSEGKSLFSESIDAVILANALFSKRSVPAFNLLVVGPRRNQKTAALSFLTKFMMGGSIVSGSSSTGKGWLVSHKEGAQISKMFSEKNCLMIDEALKFKSGEDLGVAIRIKNHFVSHMELVERKDVEGISGNGPIRGRMSCSLFCVDNPDSVVINSLGKAYKMQDASFRRWSFLWMDRLPDVKISYLTTEQAHDMMKKRFEDFGKVDAIKALMLLSRRLCERENKPADEKWVEELTGRLKSEVDNNNLFPELSFVFEKAMDAEHKKLIADEIKEHIDIDLIDAIQAAWLSAAAMRAWEECKSYDEFRLIYDERQRNLAELIIREILKGRLKLLFPGIVDWLGDHMGVKRSSNFMEGEGDNWRRRHHSY
jgi:hypothetical protein